MQLKNSFNHIHSLITGRRDQTHSRKNIIGHNTANDFESSLFKLSTYCKDLFDLSYKNKTIFKKSRGQKGKHSRHLNPDIPNIPVYGFLALKCFTVKWCIFTLSKWHIHDTAPVWNCHLPAERTGAPENAFQTTPTPEWNYFIKMSGAPASVPAI